MNTEFFIIAMLAIGTPFAVPITLAFAEEQNNSTTEILYTIKLWKNQHLVHFNVCAEDNSINSSSVMITSPQETQQLAISKVVYPNTCQSFDSIITAKHASMIEVRII